MGNERVHTCTSKKWHFNRFSEEYRLPLCCCSCSVRSCSATPSSVTNFLKLEKTFRSLFEKLLKNLRALSQWIFFAALFGHQSHLRKCISYWPCRSKWISKDFETAWEDWEEFKFTSQLALWNKSPYLNLSLWKCSAKSDLRL